MWRRSGALALLLCCGTASASMENDGVWAAGAWATTAWANGVWHESEADTIPVPDVIGMDAASADAALEGSGLDTGAVSNVCSAAALGTVVSQAPPAGTQVVAGSTVAISLSTGNACVGGGGKLRLRLDLRLYQ